MKKFDPVRLVLGLILVLSLSNCGQSGPLYLPDAAPKNKQMEK